MRAQQNKRNEVKGHEDGRRRDMKGKKMKEEKRYCVVANDRESRRRDKQDKNQGPLEKTWET